MTDAKHIPTIQELIELPTLETAQISPDGRLVAYELSQPEWEKDSYITQIWLVATEGEPEPQRRIHSLGQSTQLEPLAAVVRPLRGDGKARGLRSSLTQALGRSNSGSCADR